MHLRIMPSMNSNVNASKLRTNHNKQNVIFGARSFAIADYRGSHLEVTHRTVDFLIKHFIAALPEKLASEIRQLSEGKAIILEPNEEKTFHNMKNYRKSPEEIGNFLLGCIKNAQPQSIHVIIEPKAAENIIKAAPQSCNMNYGLGIESL